MKALLAIGGFVLVLAMLAIPARAQSPVGGALATLAAATAQADYQQQVQRAAQATRQSASYAATVQAAATRTVQAVAATQAALAELDRQRSVTATSDAASYRATSQAVQQAQNAQATLDAQRVTATAAAYQVQLATIQKRQDFGTLLLYLAGILSLAGSVWVILSWARRLAGNVNKPAVVVGEVIDLTPITTLPLLPGPSRIPDVTVIDDTGMVDAIGRWFYGSGDNE